MYGFTFCVWADHRATESTHNKILYLVLEFIFVAKVPQNNTFMMVKFGNHIRVFCLKWQKPVGNEHLLQDTLNKALNDMYFPI